MTILATMMLMTIGVEMAMSVMTKMMMDSERNICITLLPPL